MFCPNCGKEIDDKETSCYFCGANLKEKDKPNISNSIKSFILHAGRLIVDIDTSIGILGAIIVMLLFWMAIIGAFIPDEHGYFEYIREVPMLAILSFVLPVIILFFIVITKYVIYLLIDIRDSLHKIENNLQRNNDEKVPKM